MKFTSNGFQERETVRLTLTSPEQTEPEPDVSRRGVTFDDSTMVDNENMGKKSSKCESTPGLELWVSCSWMILSLPLGCCVYQKPRQFGESSSESDGEGGDCKDCKTHKKARKKNFFKQSQQNGNSCNDNGAENSSHSNCESWYFIPFPLSIHLI